VDVLSDIGLLYELTTERWCEDPGVVWVCLFSIAVSGLVNVICSAVLMWRVRSRSSATADWFDDNSAALSAVSILTIAGVNIAEILASDLFGLSVFSLYRDQNNNRSWFHRQIRYFGMPQLILEDILQLGL